jgi:hypothetical protein
MVSDTIFRFSGPPSGKKWCRTPFISQKKEGALKAPFNCLPQLLSRRAGGTLISTGVAAEVPL